jgi:hypothetical protein
MTPFVYFFLAADICIGVILFIALMIVGYCARRLFPNGIVFRSLLEMDDIKFDGVGDIESSLKTDIKTLKVNILICEPLLNRASYHQVTHSSTLHVAIEQVGLPPQPEGPRSGHQAAPGGQDRSIGRQGKVHLRCRLGGHGDSSQVSAQ